jgi:hypothetical protein
MVGIVVALGPYDICGPNENENTSSELSLKQTEPSYEKSKRGLEYEHVEAQE